MGNEEMGRTYSTHVDEKFPQNLTGETCREDFTNRSNYMYIEV
jgi:hypothetical protein